MKKNTFSFTACLKSFIFAFRGLKVLLATQHNARVHAVATIIVVALGFYFQVSCTEWAILALAMAIVWGAEAFNTALEILCDKISPEQDERIGLCKDVAAAAVLLSTIGAATAGVCVFWPYLFVATTN